MGAAAPLGSRWSLNPVGRRTMSKSLRSLGIVVQDPSSVRLASNPDAFPRCRRHRNFARVSPPIVGCTPAFKQSLPCVLQRAAGREMLPKDNAPTGRVSRLRDHGFRRKTHKAFPGNRFRSRHPVPAGAVAHRLPFQCIDLRRPLFSRGP